LEDWQSSTGDEAVSKTTYTNLIDFSEKVLWDVQVLWIAFAYNMKISAGIFSAALIAQRKAKRSSCFPNWLAYIDSFVREIWLVDA